jgi:ABC-2 type transport system permease protein
MTQLLRGFADNQPFTPIIETMRSLLTTGTPGNKVWLALVWSLGILVIMFALAIWQYKRKTFVTNS